MLCLHCFNYLDLDFISIQKNMNPSMFMLTMVTIGLKLS